MAVDINRLVLLDPLQHGVDHDKGAGAAHPGTAGETSLCQIFFQFNIIVFKKTI